MELFQFGKVPPGENLMRGHTGLTKGLAIVGTVLIWIPILAPILFTLLYLLTHSIFRFDYLMPAELALLVVVGGALLFWAAQRAGSQRWLIGAGLGVAAAGLVLSQALAVVSGLASGEREATGFWFVLVLSLLILYILAVIVTGVGGLVLVRELYRPVQPLNHPA